MYHIKKTDHVSHQKQIMYHIKTDHVSHQKTDRVSYQKNRSCIASKTDRVSHTGSSAVSGGRSGIIRDGLVGERLYRSIVFKHGFPFLSN